MPATRTPSFAFYPGDWLKDPALRSVSVAARGLWIDMLCLMSESDRRGYLQDASGCPIEPKQIARMTGCNLNQVKKLLDELEAAGVFSREATPPVTPLGHGSKNDHHHGGVTPLRRKQKLVHDLRGVIYSRRMVRDEQKRLKNKENGSKGGNPALLQSVNPPDNRPANPNPTPSISDSVSSDFSQKSVVPFKRSRLTGQSRSQPRSGIYGIDAEDVGDDSALMDWLQGNAKALQLDPENYHVQREVFSFAEQAIAEGDAAGGLFVDLVKRFAIGQRPSIGQTSEDRGKVRHAAWLGKSNGQTSELISELANKLKIGGGPAA